MRAGSLTTAPSAVFPRRPRRTGGAERHGGLDPAVQPPERQRPQSVTGLGTFNASGADKLVVVVSTEDANNNGTGFVYDVRYNGKVMTEAIQEDAGGR
jgi:hypothetical protein